MSENGLLEPGFLGPNSVVAEDYLNRGGPYWAAHGMSCLLLPRDHAFWNEIEAPLPADGMGGTKALPGAEMLVKVNPHDGEVRLFPVGQPASHWGMWQREIKYCQHAYSSYLGWCATGEGGQDLGAGRTGYSLDGERWSWRTAGYANSRTRASKNSMPPRLSAIGLMRMRSPSTVPGHADAAIGSRN